MKLYKDLNSLFEAFMEIKIELSLDISYTQFKNHK